MKQNEGIVREAKEERKLQDEINEAKHWVSTNYSERQFFESGAKWMLKRLDAKIAEQAQEIERLKGIASQMWDDTSEALNKRSF